MLGFDECLQVVEAGGPEDAVLLNPGIDGAERFGIEVVDAMTSFAVLADQVRAPQKAEMLRNGRTRHREGAGDLSCGLAAAAKQIEDGTAGGIGKGLKSGFRGGTGNRSVTHNV